QCSISVKRGSLDSTQRRKAYCVALPSLFTARRHLTLEEEMKRRILCFAFLAAVAAFMLACSASEAPPSSNTASSPVENKAALASITSNDLLKHIKTLASDE